MNNYLLEGATFLNAPGKLYVATAASRKLKTTAASTISNRTAEERSQRTIRITVMGSSYSL
jgi:hypothetical protein